MPDKFKNMKIEKRLEVLNSTDDTVDIFLYGTIREPYWWDEDDDICTSAKQFKKALDKANDKDINLHINSGGGDVFESIAIANQLKQHEGKVNVIIDALAGSGASIIAMAGDTIKMFDNSMMMIHQAWTYAAGNADELRKTASDLDKIDNAVKASYKNRFVGNEEELNNLISDETWLTAEECQVFGFCDEMLDKKDDDEEEGTKNQAFNKANLFEKYKMTNTKNQEENKANLFAKFKNKEGEE